LASWNKVSNCEQCRGQVPNIHLASASKLARPKQFGNRQ
jgi:hypothetical protein